MLAKWAGEASRCGRSRGGSAPELSQPVGGLCKLAGRGREQSIDAEVSCAEPHTSPSCPWFRRVVVVGMHAGYGVDCDRHGQ